MQNERENGYAIIIFDLAKAGIDEKQISVFIENNKSFLHSSKIMRGTFIVEFAENLHAVVDMIAEFLPNKTADFIAITFTPDDMFGFLPNPTWEKMAEIFGFGIEPWPKDK